MCAGPDADVLTGRRIRSVDRPRARCCATPRAGHAEAVAREAVTNVLRHARAAELAVTVTFDGDLAVEVSDTGIGMPEEVPRSGLRNLERRAMEAGGCFRVERAAGGGTRLMWTVPVP